MSIKRRTALSLCLIPSAASFGSTSKRDDMEARFQVRLRDPGGKPVSYADVWMALSPPASPLELDDQDLLSLSSRYTDSAALSTPFNRILPMQDIVGMTDAAGLAAFTFNPKSYYRASYPGTGSIRVTLMFVLRGYSPVRFDCSLQDLQQSATVETRRLPDIAEDDPAFGQLRFEAMVTSNISSGAPVDATEDLARRMHAQAQEWKAKGRLEDAARLFARMQYIPTATVATNITSFHRADGTSEKSLGYLREAYALQPDNPYLASRHLFMQGAKQFKSYKWKQADPNKQAQFEEFLRQLQHLMQKSGSKIWPEYHKLFALWHLRSRDERERQKAMPLIDELFRWAPKVDDRQQLMKVASFI